jgi:cellulose synthase/poly-beta-1,6-N-acetylglucosamine synthase-like glycosyltransferase
MGSVVDLVLLAAAIAINLHLLVKTAHTSIYTPVIGVGTAGAGGSDLPGLDVLVPVRNEASRLLRRNLEGLMTQDHQAHRVIVTNDQSTDESAVVIADCARRSGGRLSLINGADKPPGWIGKTFALEQAKQQSSAEWMALADADVLVEPQLSASSLAYALTTSSEAVCVLPRFTYRTLSIGLVLPVMIWLSAMRVSPVETNSRRSKKAFGFGNFILVRRDAHDAIGGFPSYRHHVLDDCEIMRRLKDSGRTVSVVDGSSLLSSPMYETLPELFLGFAKNAFASVDYKWGQVYRFLISELVGLWLPALFVVSGNPLWMVPLLMVTLTMAIAGYRLKAPPAYYALFPIGHAAAIAIVLISALSTVVPIGLKWKGRALPDAPARASSNGD